MPSPEIEEFAQVLMQFVRDAAIRSCDLRLQPQSGSMLSRKWKETFAKGSPSEIADLVVPCAVDEAMFHLLNAIDQGEIKLSFTTSHGKTVDLEVAGFSELAGYVAGLGWRTKYARERFYDTDGHKHESV